MYDRLAPRWDQWADAADPPLRDRYMIGSRFLVADTRDVDLQAGRFAAVVAFPSIIHVPRSGHCDLFERIHWWQRPGGYFVGCLSSKDLLMEVDDDWLGAGAAGLPHGRRVQRTRRP